MKKVIFLLSFLTGFTAVYSHTNWANVAVSGADPSGKIKCTDIIYNLIDSLARGGGGTLFFPAGTFLTGPIVLKSNITLYLDAGSVIKFSDDFDDYLPMVQSRWEGIRVRNFKSQIYAYRCENIAIRGDGHLEGQGKKWWDFMRSVLVNKEAGSRWQEIFKKENESLLERNAYLRSKNNFLRPPMVTTYECSNVLIEGVSFSNPPFWTIMPAFTDNITITGITIQNPDDSPNTDGIDPSSCSNVHISNCHITVGDDCIVIKSGRDEDGREAGLATENVTISNCTMLKGHGGVVIGSEMSGGVKGITISNCVFENTEIGIRVKTMRGRGGIVEDIIVSNVSMYNILNEGILITLRYQPTKKEPPSERTPEVRNIKLSGINIRGSSRPIAVYGLEERDITEISFSDFQIISQKGILLENTSWISFHNIRINVAEGSSLEVKDSRGITWDQVSVTTPVVYQPYLKFNNCQNVMVTNCFQPDPVAFYISCDEKCKNIYVVNNVLPGTSLPEKSDKRKIIFKNNIAEKSL
jgi:polygalacturonase